MTLVNIDILRPAAETPAVLAFLHFLHQHDDTLTVKLLTTQQDVIVDIENVSAAAVEKACHDATNFHGCRGLSLQNVVGDVREQLAEYLAAQND